MIHLFKKVNGKIGFVDYGIPRLTVEYERQGYHTLHLPSSFKRVAIEKNAGNDFIIHHIHRKRFNIRGRINDLICKLIPERFLNY